MKKSFMTQFLPVKYAFQRFLYKHKFILGDVNNFEIYLYIKYSNLNDLQRLGNINSAMQETNQ